MMRLDPPELAKQPDHYKASKTVKKNVKREKKAPKAPKRVNPSKNRL